MTIHDDVETRLRRAFEVNPSEDGMRWLDQRVASALARPAAARRRGTPAFRTLVRPLALAAALILVAGAVGAAVSLIERIATESGTGWHTAWDRAEVLGLKQTDAGVTITLERAYADINQVVYFFTVEGIDTPSGEGQGAPLEWSAELRDPAGRTPDQWAASIGGTSAYEPSLSANVLSWEGAVTPEAGTWQLTFHSVGYNGGGFVPGECTAGSTDPTCTDPPANAMIEGTWSFEFELPRPVGAVVFPAVTAAQAESTVTLTELRISPTMITSTIALRVAGTTVSSWQTGEDPMTLAHGDTTYATNSAYHLTQDPGDQGPAGDANQFSTPGGSAAPAGTWVITIPEIHYMTSGGSEIPVQVSGPWKLTVDLP